jgi:MFS family permease
MRILAVIKSGRAYNSLWLVYASFFCFQLPVHATQPIVSLYLAQQGAEPGLIGLVLAIAGSVSLFMAAPLGRMSDIIDTHLQVLIGCLVCIFAFAGLSQVTSLFGISVFLALIMFGHTATVLAYQSSVGSNGMVAERVQAFGWLAAAISVAQSIGPPAAGIIVDKFGIATAFLASAIVAGMSLLGVPILRARAPKNNPRTENGSKESIAWRKNRGLLYALGSSFLSSLSLNIRLSFLPLYLAGAGSTMTQIGFLFSIQAVASLAIRSQIGPLTGRLGMNRMIIAVFALSALSLAAVPFSASLIAFALISVMVGIANGIVHPLTMAVATESVHFNNQGMALGLRYAAFRLGNTISPLVLGLAANIGGLAAAFIAASSLSLVGAIGSFVNMIDGDRRPGKGMDLKNG